VGGVGRSGRRRKREVGQIFLELRGRRREGGGGGGGYNGAYYS
jgi:hypothetical protein